MKQIICSNCRKFMTPYYSKTGFNIYLCHACHQVTNQKMEIIHLGRDVRTIMKDPSYPTTRPSFALEGQIHQDTIADVLIYLEMNQRSGCLLVDSQDKPHGVIAIEKGFITYASSPKGVGRKAISQILDLENGYFRFAHSKSGKKFNCHVRITEVIMQWTKQKDEQTTKGINCFYIEEAGR